MSLLELIRPAAVSGPLGALAARTLAGPASAASMLFVPRIRRSGLFDADHYLTLYPDLASAGVVPLLHYMAQGAAEGRAPHPLFDPAFYLRRRPGPGAAGLNPLLHYLLLGDTARGADPSPLFDTAHYLEGCPEAARGELSPLEHYVAVGARRLCSPHPLFDPRYYYDRYPDIAAARLDPLVHFIKHGAAEQRDPHRFFDTGFYLAQNPDVRDAGINPLVHFVRWGAAEGRDPCPMFDTARYLRRHPALGGINPLVHYLRGGGAGEPPYRRLPPSAAHGGDGASRPLRPGKPRALFVAHEASQTGAPLLLLNIVQRLARRHDLDCVVLLDRDGPLRERFAAVATVIHPPKPGQVPDHDAAFWAQPALRDLRLAVANTVVAAPYLEPLSRRDVPTICLVHELLDLYPRRLVDALCRGAHRLVFPSQAALAAANRAATIAPRAAAVVPSALMRPELLEADGAAARGRVLRALGLGPETILVLGCGTVDFRKGADLFVSIAVAALRRTGAELHFVWVGRDPADGEVAFDSRRYTPALDLRGAEVERRVHFIGERDDVGAFFSAADIFLLSSRRDPFPCVLLEAMAAATPCVAFAGAGGAAEALDDGGGVLVPYLDLEAAAAAVTSLAAEPARRAELGARARATVKRRYGFSSYVDALTRIAAEELGVELPLRSAREGRTAQRRPRVIFTNPFWNLSGVNTFTETLMRGLGARGFDVELLFTRSDVDSPLLPDVPIRRLDEELPGSRRVWSADRWQRIIRYMEREAPCVFVPNFDYFASAVSAALSDRVGILGVVHSDHGEHYDHVDRLGRYWNAIVCVSERCYERTLEINRGFKPRLHHIPYGLEFPRALRRTRPYGAEPLRIVYTGRLEQAQKNVRAMPGLARQLDRTGLRYRLTLVGDGEELPALQRDLAPQIAAGRVRLPGRLDPDQVWKELRESDVFVLTSRFEGLPLSLIEAMACGCVPVVAEIDSGIPELIEDGVSGFRVPADDLPGFVQPLIQLAGDPDLTAQMSRAAFAAVSSGYRADRMVRAYAELIESIWRDITRGLYQRPFSLFPASEIGPIVTPRWLQRDPSSFR